MEKKMGIMLKQIRIQNFRSIESLELNLSLTNLLIGQNNTGKSNFLRAVNIALGGTSDVSEADIFVSNGESVTTKKINTIIDIMLCPIDNVGKFTDEFSNYWESVFTSDWISFSKEDGTFVGIRTEIKLNTFKDRYITNKICINEWGNSIASARTQKKSFTDDMRQYILCFYMDANRDIVQDLRNRKSFFSRIISGYEVNPEIISEIEDQLSNVNTKLVDSITPLKQMKDRISAIGNTINSDESTFEIEPLMRKLSDLNRGLDIVMKSGGASISISQTGNGTRSWISFLTLSAFVEIMEKKIQENEYSNDNGKKLYVMLTMEEPEAHLHPQAQRHLFKQMQNFIGQKLVSTHSPNIVSQSSLSDFIFFSMKSGKTSAHNCLINNSVISEDKVLREVLMTRSEILFSSAVVLCEGITEELALPVYFEEYFGCTPYSLGISIIGMGGQQSRSYLSIIKNVQIPWFIFSDGENTAIKSIANAMKDIFEYTSETLPNNIIFIENNLNYENYLISEGYDQIIEDTICTINDDQDFINSKIIKEQKKTKDDIKKSNQICRRNILSTTLKNDKTKYAKPVAENITAQNDTNMRIPLIIAKLFDVMSSTLGIQNKPK
jgi:putative ATP-dependent endonuclease of OLD family